MTLQSEDATEPASAVALCDTLASFLITDAPLPFCLQCFTIRNVISPCSSHISVGIDIPPNLVL